MSIHTVLPVLALITVAGADPLGCCMPRRFSGFILNNGGFLPDNDNSSMGVVVDVRTLFCLFYL